MEFLAQYGLYLAQTVTWLMALIILAIVVSSLFMKDKDGSSSKLKIKHINKKLRKLQQQLEAEILPKKALKEVKKTLKKAAKEEKSTAKDNCYVIKFTGDIRASDVENLRHAITSLLTVAKPTDEVVIILDSPGGIVNAYGLAASQLARIRERNIPLTVCIDKVAASGGYLMACVAHKIVAAPFAIIGSIGVVAQIPNFNKLLKKNHIDYEQMTAGEYKRTLTLFGENTDKARHKFQEDLEDIHHHFKEFIAENRSQVDVDKVSTGEHWLAKQAFDYRLVDKIATSDDYLVDACASNNVYEIKYTEKKSLGQKLAKHASLLTNSILDTVLRRNHIDV